MIVPLQTTWVHLQRSDDMIEATLVTMFTVMALTLVAVGGYALARRVGFAGRVTLLLLPLLLVAIPGRHDRTTPDEIWLETGTGSGQVLYPRGIAYKEADDTFFVVDRVARI